ncbi:MAG TPA: ATP-dependent DNA helicase RecG, partial [Sulfitobacter pontiacus]|nr:ATP-dependent DNA helicase RecG [Sulfitobacter pontiacus]
MTGRPEALFPLFAKLETLEGVGPKTAQNFAQLGVMAPRDLLFTLPYSGIDRRLQPSVKDAILPATVTVAVTVGAHRAPANKGGAYRIHVEDSATAFQLVFFHARGDYWKRQMPEGSRRVVSGRVELFDGIPQMVHPDFVVPEAEAGDIPTFEPVYPLTSGITQKLMYKATRAALSRVPEVGEWIDPNQKNQENWPDFPDALQQAHAPNDTADLSAAAPARARLAYDELLAHQLTLALARAKDRRKAGCKTVGDGQLQQRVLGALPYAPTGAQTRAIAEISKDMASGARMNRLLQGDVGAGKTLVAFMALLRAVEAGGQGVLMAPTEILAR